MALGDPSLLPHGGGTEQGNYREGLTEPALELELLLGCRGGCC